MQKIRLQIMLGLEELNSLHEFQLANHCKNESQAISKVFILNSRYQFIIKKLEEKAHEAQEWKSRAESKVGIALNPITAGDAEASTDLKQKSEENTKDIREQDVQLSKEQKKMSKRVAKKIKKQMEEHKNGK